MQQTNPLVSILLPIYNVEQYIVECAESIVNQTYKNIEVIFFDDKSPDNSVSILEKYIYETEKQRSLPLIKIIRSSHNVGLAEGRNECIKRASGDYICFVDSDDLLPIDSIENLITKALAADADIVIGQFSKLSCNGSIKECTYNYPDNKTEHIQQLLERNLPLSVWRVIYKSELLKKSEVEFYAGHDFGEDYSFSARIQYCANKIVTIPQVVYYYRENSLSITRSRYSLQKAEELLGNYNVISKFYCTKSDFDLYEKSLEISGLKIRNYILSCLPLKSRLVYARKLPTLKTTKNISRIGLLKSYIVLFSPRLFGHIDRYYPEY